jgi:outer membrane receptor protein involved in Fe transport
MLLAVAALIGFVLVRAATAATPAAPPPPPPPSPSPSPSPIALRETIIVTAERAPESREETAAAVSVLDRERLQGLPAENLAEALDSLPGLRIPFASAFGGVPMVGSRGFFGGGEAEYVLLVVDGVPAADAESGLADWRRLRTAQIDRVEVLHGPGSSVYGDAALGGVVHVFTRAAAAGDDGSLSISAGRFDSAAVDLTWTRLRRLRVGLSGTASRTGGFRDHAGHAEGGLDAVVSGPAAGGLWSVAASASRRDRDDPGALAMAAADRDADVSDPLFRFDAEATTRARAALSFHREGRSTLRALLGFAARDAEQTRTLLLVPGVGDRARRDLSTDALLLSLEAGRDTTLGKRPSRGRIGLELGFDDLDTAYFAVDDSGAVGARTAAASGERLRVGVYLTHDWRPTAGLRATAGVRWDSVRDGLGPGLSDNRHDAWSPRLGLNVRLGNAGGVPLVAHVQASRAFKAATIDQVLDPRPFPDGAGGTFTISNPGLAPQHAGTVEVGLRREGAIARWSVVGYTMSVDDEIDFDPATFRYVNIGRSRHAGLEARLALAEGRTLAPHVSYAWTRVGSREPERRRFQLKNVPEHVLRLGLRATLPAGFSGELRFTRRAGLYLDDANAFPVDDASLVDLRLRRPVGRRFSARLDLLNLTNERSADVGFVLADFAGGVVPYVLPPAGFAFRIGLSAAF